MATQETIREVLVVDDNRMYREAVRRNLEFVGYYVTEAENRSDALERIRRRMPHVVITDLDMRTRTEGLDLIRDIKARYPMLPVVLISAVGTFDEGALARQYGAMYVISKSRIDEEIENLYAKLDQVFEKLKTVEALREKVDSLLAQDTYSQESSLEEDLNRMLTDEELDSGVKSEVFDMLVRIRDRSLTGQLADHQPSEGEQSDRIEEKILKELPSFNQLNTETKTMLRTAENLLADSQSSENLAILRNISFSYTFAVENEVKLRVGRKVTRFVVGGSARGLIDKMFDPSLGRGNLDLFFNQHVILTFQRYGLDLNVDITRQVLDRMLMHGEKYKPDGLKALGVIIFCFGRAYKFRSSRAEVAVGNPMGLSGLSEEETVRFSNALIRLQHLRNPYIHPEFSEREKIDNIRQIAYQCLNYASQIEP